MAGACCRLVICHFPLYKIEANQRQKYISSIKLENVFCDWFGQGAFYRDNFGALLRSVVCKNETWVPSSL
jgi:hypothetical protein